jgi:riboflavin synthase alpha subunit
VAALDSGLFSVALIPTTLERTTLAQRQTGDTVNIESDMMVRTVVQYLQQLFAPDHDNTKAAAPLSLTALREVVFGSLQTQGIP